MTVGDQPGRPVILEAIDGEISRRERLRAWIDTRFPELYAAAAILGLFALTDPGDRIGFATGAVATALAALVVTRRAER